MEAPGIRVGYIGWFLFVHASQIEVHGKHATRLFSLHLHNEKDSTLQ
jgi:hypothetical protein